MSDEILFLKNFTLILEAKWAFGFLHCFQCHEDHLLLILEVNSKQIIVTYY